MSEWFEQPIARIAEALRAGRVRSEDLVEEAIANRDGARTLLGAYKHWAPDDARAEARLADRLAARGRVLGPLHGIPVAIKDLYGVPGMPTFAGTPRRLPEAWERPGPVVEALLRQFVVVMGKTHTVEFAFGGIGTNPHWETPRNPWDTAAHRVPGGSSSGAGVSLAEGSSLLALGTDTAGSVRIPASMTGNVGLKTTWPRWSLDGIVPLSRSLDTAGVLTRTAVDATTAFVAIDSRAGPGDIAELDTADIRIGICDEFFWDDCSPGIAEVVHGALDELVRKGARARPLDLPSLDEANRIFRKGGLAAVELYDFLQAELPEWLETIDPNVRHRMAEARNLPAHEYLGRRRVLERCAAAADACFDTVDVMAAPTVPVTPPTVDELKEDGVYPRKNMMVLRNTFPANFLGLCAITLPVGLDRAGLPVGLQLMARGGAEERLLAVAVAVERALGTALERLGRAPLRRNG